MTATNMCSNFGGFRCSPPQDITGNQESCSRETGKEKGYRMRAESRIN